MSNVTPATSQTPFSGATINALGGFQIATGGGCIVNPPVITTAGSADAVLTLYDGTSTSGQPLATFSLAAVRAAMMPNSCFSGGLYAEMTGTTAGTVSVTFSGTAA